MTRDQIAAWAEDAGVWFAMGGPHRERDLQRLTRFAALVAEHAEAAAFERSNREWRLMCAKMVAAEKERCAQICDAEASIEGIAQRCAAAIRGML